MQQECSFGSKKRFHIKSHKILRLHTVEKESQLDDHNLFLNKKASTKVRINSMKTIYLALGKSKIRKYTEIQEELTFPESPSKLSPCKQCNSFIISDQTKLKLSAQSWVIHDMKTSTYKRGWKPNKPSKFNGLLRVVVLLCYCEIMKQNEKLRKIKIKINYENLKQFRLKSSKKDENQLKWIASTKKVAKTYAKGSIVYLIDMVKSMIISGAQDLLEYCIICCGYLIAKLKASSAEGFNDCCMIHLTQEREEEIYANEFCQFCNDFYFHSLGLENTSTENQEQGYELKSTVNEMLKIFTKGFFEYPFFRETISLQTHSYYLKFQVGYKFWEDRMMTVKNPNGEIKGQYFCYLVYRGTKNYEALVYHSEYDILMVIEDSKFAMAELDIDVLEKWYYNVTKPIGSGDKNKSTVISPPKSKKSIFPILAITKS